VTALPLARRVRKLDMLGNVLGHEALSALADAIKGGAAPELAYVKVDCARDPATRDGGRALLWAACEARGIRVRESEGLRRSVFMRAIKEVAGAVGISKY
jgi:hypothetical protein